MTRHAGFGLGLLLSWAGVSGCTTGRHFSEDFHQRLQPGWTILREQPDAWRATADGLEVRVLPGNMWGGSNDARNTFVRPVPDPAKGPVEITITVENRPTEQYEQVDLLWYYADSHQVKIGQELVDGQLSIVMGREENDRTRTVKIIPLDSAVVELRLRADGSQVEGSFRTPSMKDWQVAGKCDLPVKDGGPKVSLQVYQGSTKFERWAHLRHLRIRQTPR